MQKYENGLLRIEISYNKSFNPHARNRNNLVDGCQSHFFRIIFTMPETSAFSPSPPT